MQIKFNEYELDAEIFELRRKGQVQPLEPQVFNLLAYLAQHRNRIVSRRELLDELWAHKVVTDSTLNCCVKEARQAVGDNARTQKVIATFNRRGYRFVAPVEVNEPVTEPKFDGMFTYLHKHYPDRPSLAVLPFSFNDGQDSVSWVADMLSRDISIQLARIPGFIVLSRNSAASYKGAAASSGQIGQELGADYIVDGSVWELGKSLRISVQLHEVVNDRILWANSSEIEKEKLNKFLQQTVYQISGRIVPELNRAELSNLKLRQPVELGAWELYRQGHANLSIKGWSEESFAETVNLLRQAIEKDPELAFAHAYLSLILAIGHLVGLVTDESWHDEAMTAAETAIALDNQDSDILGYVGCALVDMGRLTRGVGMIERAIELDPSNAQAHAALGAVMLRLENEEGIEVMRHGMRISPRDNRLAVWGALLARGLLSFGRIEEAIEAADHACRSDDKIFLPRLVLALAQNVAGNQEAARNALDEARRIRPRLSIDDLSNFASTDEIAGLACSGILKTENP